MIYINKIDLRKPIFQTYYYGFAGNYIYNDVVKDNPFNKINIVVGENNSGKSRFIRSLFASFDYSEFNDPNDRSRNAIKAYLSELTEMTNTKIFGYNSDRDGTPFYRILKLNLDQKYKKLEEFRDNVFNHVSDLNELIELLSEIRLAICDYLNNVRTNQSINQRFEQTIFSHSEKIINKIDEMINMIKKKENEIRVDARYIPIFRGLKPLMKTDEVDNVEWIYENLYQERVFYEYFNQYNKIELKDMIFTGQNFYELIKSRLLGVKQDRELINNYERYLSKNFFEGEEVSIYPNDSKKIVLVKIGDDEERPIHDLGDGIQSIIILTYEMFAKMNSNMMFFIEEPEVYLHPKYQRRLIETFMKEEFESFQFFITTHSNHFLDLVFDYSGINIFTICSSPNSYNKKFLIEKELDDSYRPYELLGVRSSSLLLSNCTIWVEGISDKKYINKYLELYQNHIESKNEFREDIHFTYIEYGGNNITHWDFLDDDGLNSSAITKNIFVIADNDFTKSEKKLQRQNKLKVALGDRFCLLNVREIENTLSAKVLKSVITEYCSKSKKPIEFNSHFDNENKYYKEYLGKYIDKNLDLPRKFSSYSGTIRDKHKFSKIAIDCINDYDDLSDEAIRIAQEVYQFIKRSNDTDNHK